MLQLLVLADDFTGALDTGVQFSQDGIRTQVVEAKYMDLSGLPGDVQVLVVNMDTRHLPPADAYKMTRSLAKRALEGGVLYIYKKTDSGLRGNIGSELKGLMDAAKGSCVAFAPAYPRAQRVVRDGILYIMGEPVSHTVFGKDPFEPVCNDAIPDIIAEQANIPVRIIKKGPYDACAWGRSGEVLVFDADDEETLTRIAHAVVQAPGTKMLAGCAGFARCLTGCLAFSRQNLQPCKQRYGLVAISGSITDINMEQLKVAAWAGIPVLNIDQKLLNSPDMISSPEGIGLIDEALKLYGRCGCVVLAARRNDDGACKGLPAKRERVACNVARATRKIWELVDGAMLAVFGGDTLQAVLRELNCRSLEPICEIETGVAYSRANCAGGTTDIISKSGNLGGSDVVSRMVAFARGNCNQRMEEPACLK